MALHFDFWHPLPLRHRQRGLNIFEFIAILGIVFGLAFGFSAALDQGFWEAVLGALRGGAIAYGWWVAGMFMLLMVLWLFLRYRPMFPVCKSGRCKQADYLYQYLDSPATGQHKRLEDEYQGKLLRCRCGTLYLDCSRDRRFYEVRDDGALVGFMRYRPLGRWRADKGEPPRPARA
jgi:hypothetical protein